LVEFSENKGGDISNSATKLLGRWNIPLPLVNPHSHLVGA